MNAYSEFLNRYLLRHAGMDLAHLHDLTTDEADAEIGKKIGKQIKVSPPNDDRLLGRGSVLLTRLSFTEDVDREISRI